MAEPELGTRLFRREHAEWGVPRATVNHAAYVVEQVQRDYEIGTAVRAVRWFREADALARDGDRDVFRGREDELGYVAVAEPDVIWLRAELSRLSVARLTRTVVHELVHADALARRRLLTVEEHERLAADVTAIICRGVAG